MSFLLNVLEFTKNEFPQASLKNVIGLNWGDQTLSNTDIIVNGLPLPASADLEAITGSELKSSYGAKEFTGTFSLITPPAIEIGSPVVILPYSVTHFYEP